MLRIVTDGAADMPVEWGAEYDIHTIPINVQFGDKTYLQFIDLDLDGLYRMIDETRVIPKTSQPSPHQFTEFYKKIAQPGDTILSVHVTSKLSGTYASAVAAAEGLRGTYNVVTYDSLGGSLGLGFMCRQARRMANDGKSVDEIIAYFDSIRDQIQIILTLDKLDFARMSGRVGTLSAALASVLNVKPIAVLKDGLVNMVEKVRTRRASLDRVLAMGKAAMGDAPVFLGVMHARDPQSGQALLDEARKMFNVKEAVLTDLSISLAVNFGPGTVGLILYPAA
jgi:DegV family protein with EDD domain